MKIIWWGT